MKILEFLADIFGFKIKVDNKAVRRCMYQYFHYHEWGYESTISDVVVEKQDGKLIVTTTTHRPGLLIGKAGIFIDGLRDWIKEELKVDVEMKIKENLLWHKLYS